MTDRTLPAGQSVEAVLYSFTQAELALAEVTSAVAKFQAASEQLSRASAENATAVEAMRAATAASIEVARQLEATVKVLGDTTTTLKAIDPPRLWKFLGDTNKWQESVEAKRVVDAAAIDGRTRLIVRISSFGALAAVVAAALAGAALLGLGVR